MPTKKMTGKKFFLRCAWACAEDQFRLGKISQTDFDELKRLVETGDEPSAKLLERCFPRANDGLNNFSNWSKQRKWALKTVKELWLNRHGRVGHCGVRKVRVIGLFDNQLIQVREGTKILGAENTFNLKLKPGDEVVIHRHVIVIKA